jgi:cytochrome c-type biogenesis protein
MDLNVYALVGLPIGLGLLGFIEPCTIGGHLVFLESQASRARLHRVNAALMFASTRSLVSGLFGALIALLGQYLIVVQTGAWFIFGVIYTALGLAFLIRKSGLFRWKVDLAPSTWKQVQNPVVLGLAFGLNIPACAAPILFGLLGLAGTAGTALAGFVMMFLFGLALTFPLIAVATDPRISDWLKATGAWMKQRPWMTGSIFILLGLWSIWFGLYVDPSKWSGG